jgi:hypothetical protein
MAITPPEIIIIDRNDLMARRPVAPDRLRGLGTLFLGLLLLTVALHAVGVGLDFLAAIRDPQQLDYGEGPIWQQVLQGGLRYDQLTSQPFVPFNYPPLFHLLVRAILWLQPDVLAAGRIISAVSALLLVPATAGLVLASTGYPGRPRGRAVAISAAAGLLVLGLSAVRTWGLVMRVDIPGIVFAITGLLVAARADGRFRGTALALLFCLAAVFTKQTLLPSGVAVFLVAFWRRPAAAVAAAAVAGAVGVATVAWLQAVTGGGFLHHLVADNISRFSAGHAWSVLQVEQIDMPAIACMVVAAALLARSVVPLLGRGKEMTRIEAAHLLVLLHFLLCALMLVTIGKVGSNVNYFLEFLAAGGVVLGVVLVDRDAVASQGRFVFLGLIAILALTAGIVPLRQMPDVPDPADVAIDAMLIQRIAAATKPVASDNMGLLLRAGKTIPYEPSSMTELASVGRWDETPLLDMIRRHDFAFMITVDGAVDGSERRTPAVDAARREAYPRIEQMGPFIRVWSPL